MDEAAALRLRTAAEAEIARLVEAGQLRFVARRRGRVRPDQGRRREGLAAEQGEDLRDEAECSLLELVEAGLPEWVEWSQAETFTPREFRGPVAVLQEIPPECLDEAGQVRGAGLGDGRGGAPA